LKGNEWRPDDGSSTSTYIVNTAIANKGREGTSGKNFRTYKDQCP